MRWTSGRRIALWSAIIFLTRPLPCCAQSPPESTFARGEVFQNYQAFQDELAAIASTGDAAKRTARLDAFWAKLRAAGQIPFALGDRYAMLYRGEATSVAFAGDHTKWRPTANAKQLAGTDLWIYEGKLPSDARVDYKIVLNGNNWILDPVNPLQMWSGFGPNSELRMPDYKFPQETIYRPDASRGAISDNIRIESSNLGYSVQYRVYTPSGYDAHTLANLPVAYITDGHEYAHDATGSATIVLDNLIDEGALRPMIAVFIDSRDPSNLAHNRRIAEYNMNPKFADFVGRELVPTIDAAYRTSPFANDRLIIGTSMGGLNAAYFGATQADVFHKIGIQSPAFRFNPSIYCLYSQPPPAPLKIFMTAGTINDGNGGVAMKTILAKFGYDFTFKQVNEGHSWGSWRAQLAEMLTDLIGGVETGPYGTACAKNQGPRRARFGAGYNLMGGGMLPSSSAVAGRDLVATLRAKDCGRQANWHENSSCRSRAERRKLRGCWRPHQGGRRSCLRTN